jgi:hypothetical protein
MVTVFTSKLPDEEFYLPDDLYDRYVLPAVEADEPLPADPDAVATLQAAIAAW